MTTARRRAWQLAAAAAVLALLLLFARQVDWGAAAAAVRGADPWLLVLAAALNIVSLSLKGVRWWVFLRPVGVRGLGLVMRATYAGASLNNLLVAQGGEGARVLMVARGADVSSAPVLAALAVERLLDAVCYLALLVAAAWLLPLPEEIARWRLPASVALAAIALAAGFVAMRSRADAAPRGPDGAGRVRSYLRRVGSGVGEVTSPGRLLAGAALSVVAWALQVATYHLVALATGSAIPLGGSIAALLAVGVSFLVRATPGNVGVFQMVYAVTVRSFGVTEGAAVAIAGLIQLVQVVPTVGLGAAAGLGRFRESSLPAPPP